MSGWHVVGCGGMYRYLKYIGPILFKKKGPWSDVQGRKNEYSYLHLCHMYNRLKKMVLVKCESRIGSCAVVPIFSRQSRQTYSSSALSEKVMSLKTQSKAMDIFALTASLKPNRHCNALRADARLATAQGLSPLHGVHSALSAP